MEKIKLQTIEKILSAKSFSDSKSHVMFAIQVLEEHKVHKHLINRFILKLVDQLTLKKILVKDSEIMSIIDETLYFLKNMNYH